MVDQSSTEMPWGKAETDRLAMYMEVARRQGLTQQDIAERVGISRATLQRVLAGTNPGFLRFAAIAEAIGVAPEKIVKAKWIPNAESIETDMVQVPIADIRVAAGDGRFALDEATIGTWPFPRGWIDRQWPKGELRVVHVAGDSQEPVLRDGDAVLVDLTPTNGSDGMHIVRLDDALMIKRVQIEGVRVRLKSHNPQYDDIVVHLRDDADRFAIVGRAVAAVKTL